MRLPVDPFLPLAALALLSACGGGGHTQVASALATSGPAADYPVVLGEPFTIDGVTYTPADKLNYDQVGYAMIGVDDGSTAVSAAHRTLPLPSYAEVTSLETGKTILVRVERRGPPSGNALVELSPGAATQLGAGARTAVRVRRVNPPEIERAALRSGDRAPDRMETPKSLLAVLQRKLDPGAPAPLVATGAKPTALAGITGSPKPRNVVAPAKPDPAPATAAIERPVARTMIQVGAFGSKTNADATATRVGGSVSQSGRLWRVRMGPYQARSEIAAALAKARGAGYSDARIQRAD